MSIETQSTGYERRVEEIKQIQKEHRPFYILIGAIAGVLVGLALGAFLFDSGAVSLTESGYSVNVYTEIFGILVTVLLIGWWNNRLEYRRLRSALKSRATIVSVDAIRILRERHEFEKAVKSSSDLDYVRWEGARLTHVNLPHLKLYEADLSNSLMQFINLEHAALPNCNLAGSNLWEANLKGADLNGSDFSGSEMILTHLERASLSHTNFMGAYLESAKLIDAVLIGTNLEGADLLEANLTGADFRHANLKNANLLGAIITEETLFDEKTVLPDGSYWSGDVKISRFTDLEDPDLWYPPNLDREVIRIKGPIPKDRPPFPL